MGILLARLSVGLLFAISGGSKLFAPARRDEMRRTITAAGLPAPAMSAVLISSVEFMAGIFLVLGFLTPLCCLLLIGNMLGALGTTVIPGMKSSSVLDWLGEFLYLPEVLYVVILVGLLLSGPGWLSLDQLILPSSLSGRND
jgi:putative oxidoreductase